MESGEQVENPKVSNLARHANTLNAAIGKMSAWLLVVMVVVQFAVVLLRYVYSTGEVWLTESLFYLHGFIIMCGCAYTLQCDGHVKIDIFSSRFSPQTLARVEFFANIFLLMPFCLATLYFATPYVMSSWRVLESSTETNGLPAVYILKTTMLIFCLSLLMQAVSALLTLYPKIHKT